MPNCNTFLVTEAERNMSSDDGYFNNTENRATFTFLPTRQYAEGNSSLSHNNNREHARCYATVKPGWPSLKVAIFPPVLRLVLEEPNTEYTGDY